MSIVLTVAQQKGGAGKTSLVAHLAAFYAATRRVAVLDIDPQRSLSRWLALRTSQSAKNVPELIGSDVSGWRLATEIDRLRRACDMLIVDSPPQVDHDARRAIRTADLLLIPIQPSVPDLWAAEGTLTLAKQEKRPARLVMNRVAAGSKALAASRSLLEAAGLTALTASLGNRAAYQQAFAAGLGVTEGAPRSVAAAEMAALAAEIITTLPG